MNIMEKIAFIFILFISFTHTNYASQDYDTYPTAIFDFVEKSKHMEGMGEKISDIIFANLVADPNISLVDRDELAKLEDEAVLNLSGMVNSQQANQIGQLTGAKIIITGTVFEIEDKLMLVAKIISAETSRVMGATVKGDAKDSIVSLTEELSKKIAESIAKNAGSLVAKPVSKSDRIAELKQKLKSVTKPNLTINITEHHINRAASDPAAETEMMLYSIETGFEVVDKNSKEAEKADILIIGEGFTEFATRKGDIVGVKARLEVKVLDQATNRIIAVDRQTVIEVDLSEIIAGKKALERASARIAERILPKITQQYNGYN